MGVFAGFAFPALMVTVGCLAAGATAHAEPGKGLPHKSGLHVIDGNDDARRAAVGATMVPVGAAAALGSVTSRPHATIALAAVPPPVARTAATRQPSGGNVDSEGASRGAALVLAGLAAVGFVGRRLRG
jgi:hypothetical protein